VVDFKMHFFVFYLYEFDVEVKIFLFCQDELCQSIEVIKIRGEEETTF